MCSQGESSRARGTQGRAEPAQVASGLRAGGGTRKGARAGPPPPAALRALPPRAAWLVALGRAGVFTWKQKHVLPGAGAVPAVPAARHAARLLPGPKRGSWGPAAAGLSPRSAGLAGAWRKMAGEGSVPGGAARGGPGGAQQAARGTNLVSFPEPAGCSC